MITFGMVSVPVRLYTMVSPKSIRFNNLHAACGTQVKQPTHCPACDLDLDTGDLIKGYKVGGTVVQLTAEDLNDLPLLSSKAIDIAGFIDAEDVPFYRFDLTYFVGPDDRNNVGQKAFQLLWAALDESEKVAVARMARSGKESLVVIRPFGKVLALSYLHWTDEMNEIEPIEGTVDETALSEPELEMARMLVDSMPDASELLFTATDGYREAVEAMIETKLAGGEPEHLPTAPKPPVPDLLAALRASVEEARAAKGAKAS